MQELKNLIDDLIRLQVGVVKWVESNTHLRINTERDFDKLLLGNNFLVTYGKAVENLINYIHSFCQDEKILKAALEIQVRIGQTELHALRFGQAFPHKKYTKLESELNMYRFRRRFELLLIHYHGFKEKVEEGS